MLPDKFIVPLFTPLASLNNTSSVMPLVPEIPLLPPPDGVKFYNASYIAALVTGFVLVSVISVSTVTDPPPEGIFYNAV
jgi:hypothetical protein